MKFFSNEMRKKFFFSFSVLNFRRFFLSSSGQDGKKLLQNWIVAIEFHRLRFFFLWKNYFERTFLIHFIIGILNDPVSSKENYVWMIWIVRETEDYSLEYNEDKRYVWVVRGSNPKPYPIFARPCLMILFFKLILDGKQKIFRGFLNFLVQISNNLYSKMC